jgi:hypothetical protein
VYDSDTSDPPPVLPDEGSAVDDLPAAQKAAGEEVADDAFRQWQP